MTEVAGLLDAHAHLGDASFDDDRESVLDRARAVGVEAVVTVGETLADARRGLELAKQFTGRLLPAAGLYPTVLDPAQAEEVVTLVRERAGDLVAIGEVGLDHWKVQEPDDLETQREIFRLFIALSRETDLPLNVHSRSAGRATIELLLADGASKVLMHAFDGRAASAQAGIEAGFFFSVPPSVVRSQQKQKLVRRLPLENLLLETDSPVLGPEVGKRNEPANVRVSLAEVARLKQLPLDEVAAAVIENQRRLFGYRALHE